MEKINKKRKFRAKGIAETYMYISDVPPELSISKAQLYLEEHASIWAGEHFKSDVRVKVVVSEGSLKVNILVGSLAAYNIVAGYGSFRTGIDYLVKDSQHFSEHVIESFKQDENISSDAIRRTERRLGIPGKIQRFYKALDKINSQDLSHNQRTETVEELKDEFLIIIELLEDERDRDAFMEELPNEIKPLPNQPLPPPIIGALSIGREREDE